MGLGSTGFGDSSRAILGGAFRFSPEFLVLLVNRACVRNASDAFPVETWSRTSGPGQLLTRGAQADGDDAVPAARHGAVVPCLGQPETQRDDLDHQTAQEHA